MPTIIAACVILHNICETHKVGFNKNLPFDNSDSDEEQDSNHSSFPASLSVLAAQILNILVDYFHMNSL